MENQQLFTEQGIIITCILILIPILLIVILIWTKLKAVLESYRLSKELNQLHEKLITMPAEKVKELEAQRDALAYSLTHDELGSNLPTADYTGLIATASKDTGIFG